MSDDNGNDDGLEEWRNEVDRTLGADELGEKPDIWEIYDRDSVDDPENWEKAWEFAPDDQSDNFYDALIETIANSDWEWEDIYDAMYEDFWDWFRENYEGS